MGQNGSKRVKRSQNASKLVETHVSYPYVTVPQETEGVAFYMKAWQPQFDFVRIELVELQNNEYYFLTWYWYQFDLTKYHCETFISGLEGLYISRNNPTESSGGLLVLPTLDTSR